MEDTVKFQYGAMSDTLEKQAKSQGYTLGSHAKFAEKIKFGLVASHIHGVLTDSEYKKALDRFHNKIVLKNLKKAEKKKSKQAK